MNAPQFLESLTNIPNTDYLHAHKERNPAFFLRRADWLVCQFPPLQPFLKTTTLVHLTGTSGKGSTGALLQAILAETGARVGFYHSPHVQDVYERMRVMQRTHLFTIPPKTFANLTHSIKPVLERAIVDSPYGLPSYFEILFTLALLYFKDISAEYVILEAGCGGRFDATNVVPKKKLAIITSIGYDHTHLIGPRLNDIAHEKAGIIAKGSAVLLGPTISRNLQAIIAKEAKTKNALLYTLKKSDEDQNEAIARRAAEILSIPKEVIERGLKNHIPLPGRLSIVKRKPLIILDGAHNRDKVIYLLEHLAVHLKGKRKKILIFAAVETKNWKAMLTLLLPRFDAIYLTRHSVLQRKSADLKQMYYYATKQHKKVYLHIDPEDAFKTAQEKAHPNDIIVVTGSLYLLGNVITRKTIL